MFGNDAQDPSLELPDGHESCNMALDFSVWQLILADQSPRLRWRLPPGVAFHFKAGEQLAAQTHFVDTGLLDTDGEGFSVMNLHAMPAKRVRAYAGAIFGQDRDVVVPPGTTSNVGVWSAADASELDLLLAGLPAFRYMTIRVEALALHYLEAE